MIILNKFLFWYDSSLEIVCPKSIELSELPSFWNNLLGNDRFVSVSIIIGVVVVESLVGDGMILGLGLILGSMLVKIVPGLGVEVDVSWLVGNLTLPECWNWVVLSENTGSNVVGVVSVFVVAVFVSDLENTPHWPPSTGHSQVLFLKNKLVLKELSPQVNRPVNVMEAVRTFLEFHSAGLAAEEPGAGDWVGNSEPLRVLGALQMLLEHQARAAVFPGGAWTLAPKVLVIPLLALVSAAVSLGRVAGDWATLLPTPAIHRAVMPPVCRGMTNV